MGLTSKTIKIGCHDSDDHSKTEIGGDLQVNYNILGGWKYVNEKTGEYFKDEHDFEPALKKLLFSCLPGHFC